jgi:Phage integrase family
MENLRLREAAPTSVNVTVGKRSREYLTDREVERLIEAAKQNRSGHRDATAILVAYRHGLRASELVALRWDDIDLATGRLHVRRAKSGDASVHPISARESRALRKLLRRSSNVPIRLHLGASRAVVRSRVSAHGCQGGRGCEIHVPRAFPHAAACLRVQARQRRPRHSRHSSLSRPPIDHVDGPLHGLDAEPLQKLLEGLTSQASRIKRRLSGVSGVKRPNRTMDTLRARPLQTPSVLPFLVSRLRQRVQRIPRVRTRAAPADFRHQGRLQLEGHLLE